ncbi:MAG: PDZ domain-containing protein [Isosphaeraceae bacterium]|nr:PDZ domain-containing protein [Isosphaeraceae bacterium]
MLVHLLGLPVVALGLLGGLSPPEDPLSLKVDVAAGIDPRAADLFFQQVPQAARWVFLDPRSRAWGARLAPVDDVLRSQLDLPRDQGLVITEIDPNGPLGDSPLRDNDILLTLDGKPVDSVDDFDRIARSADDRPLKAKVLRKGDETTIELTIKGRRGREAAVSEHWIGVSVSPADEILREQLDLPEGQGLVVTEVVPDSPAAKAGLKKNDILLTFDGKPLGDIKALVDQVQAADGKSVSLKVLRGGKSLTLDIKPERRPAHRFGRGAPEDEVERLRGLFARPGVVVPRLDQPIVRSIRPIPDRLDQRLDEIDRRLKDLTKTVDELRQAIKGGSRPEGGEKR